VHPFGLDRDSLFLHSLANRRNWSSSGRDSTGPTDTTRIKLANAIIKKEANNQPFRRSDNCSDPHINPHISDEPVTRKIPPLG
jgi:hypothetical protein